MNDLLDAALYHNSLGRPVLAITQDKTPYKFETGWDRWFREPQTEEQVREIFSNGAYGIAVMAWPACNLCVLDFDGKHSQEAWEKTGIVLPETARNFTRSGYFHLIFQMDTDATPEGATLGRNIKLAKADNCDCTKNERKKCGVDFLVNGYFIVPPTRNYREDPDRPFEKFAKIPAEVVRLAAKIEAVESGYRERFNTERALNGVPEGERDDTVFKLACTLRGAGVPQDVAEELILRAARNCEPPFPDDKALKKVSRAYSRYKPRGSDDDDEPDSEDESAGPKQLPQLDAGDHDLARISDAALKVLVESNDPPYVFRHAGSISRLATDETSSAAIRPMNEASLRGILGRIIDWREKKKKRTVAALPPRHIVDDILANVAPPFPVVTRIVRAPVFAADGTLVTKPGYNANAKVYYDPAPGFDVAPVPKEPTPEDRTKAREQIDDILFDFPFVSPSEKAHAVALIVQPFAREMIDGPTPLFLVEKPSPGTGAGLLVDVVTSVFLGRGAAVLTEGRSEEEWRKRIMAKLVSDNTMILVDNVRKRLESSALSAALTAFPVFEDRRLGKTEMVGVAVRATWIATGNNPSLSNEMARRTVRIRLDAKVDRPWLREDFKHPDLRGYVASERGKLVWSALVLIQEWMSKGRPLPKAKLLGSFESWTKVVGGVVENAGFEEFLGNLEELYEQSDAEGAALRTFVATWWEKYQSGEVTVAQLYRIVDPEPVKLLDGTIEQDDPIDLDLGNGKTEQSRKVKLGILLRENRDRQFDGKRILQGGKYRKSTLWKLESTTR